MTVNNRIKKRIRVIIIIIAAFAVMYVVSMFIAYAFGNPFHISKAYNTPNEALTETTDKCSIDNIITYNGVGIAFCKNDKADVLRYLRMDENNKWHDITENIMYCRNLVDEDKDKTDSYRVKVKKYKNVYFACVSQMNYDETNSMISVTDSLGSEFKTYIRSANGKNVPTWFWRFDEIPKGYTITVDGTEYAVDD